MNNINPITKIFDDMPTYHLKECLEELFEWRSTGMLNQAGTFSAYADDVNLLINDDFGYALTITENNILTQSAKRWLKLHA